MKSAAKVLGVLALLAGALAAAGTVALKKFLPPDKVRSLVIDGARKTLHREVRLKGISLSLLKGLSIEGLEVSEVPDFGAGAFASAGTFSLRVKLLPLMRKKVIVDSIVLEGLKVSVRRGRGGRFNFEDMTSSAAVRPASAGVSAPGTALELAVRRAIVRESELTYKDVVTGEHWKVTALQAQVDDFGLARPFDAEISLKAAGRLGERPIDAALSFAGRLDPGGIDPDRVAVDIRRASIEQAGARVEVSGAMKGLRRPKGELEVAVSFKGAKALSGKVTAQAGQEGGGTDFGFDVKTTALSPSELRELLALAGASAPEGLSLPVTKVQGKALWAGDRVKVSRLLVTLPAGTVELNGEVTDLQDKPRARLEAALKLERLPALRSRDFPWLKLPESFSSPEASLEGVVRLEGEALELDRLKARTAAGWIEVSGTVAQALSRPRPVLAAMMKLDLPAFTSADLPFAGVPAGLRVPASKWEGAVSGGLDRVKLGGLRVLMGSNDLQVDGEVHALESKSPVADLMLRCRAFDLGELTQLTEALRQLKLTGSGLFAIGVTGALERPALAGKLQFLGVGATMAGLAMSDFSGTANFDEKRLDVPNLKGKVADGLLTMDLSVKDYAKAPAIDLVAELDVFDLGRFLAAKTAMAAAKTAPAKAPEKKEDAVKSVALSARGKLSVKRLVHPNAVAQNVKVDWDLDGITPDLRRLGGTAKLSSTGGHLDSIGSLATQSRLLKVLILPVLILQKLSLGGLRILPDLNNIDYEEILGDYTFRGGLMTLNDSHLYSSAANVTSKGTIDLPSEQLDLVVTAQVGHVSPIDVGVTGSFDKPVAKAKLVKFLAEPAKQLLQNLFK